LLGSLLRSASWLNRSRAGRTLSAWPTRGTLTLRRTWRTLTLRRSLATRPTLTLRRPFAAWGALTLRARPALTLRAWPTRAPKPTALAARSAKPAAITTGRTLSAPLLAHPSAHWRYQRFLWERGNFHAALIRQHLTAINPDLDPNHPKGGMRFGIIKINIGAQRLKRNLALNLFLGARNLGATKPPTNHNFNAFGARAHGFLDCLLHGPTEGDTLLQLFGNAASHQIGISFWLPNLNNIQADLFLGLALQHLPQVFHLLAAFANDNPWLGSMNRDGDLLTGRAFNLHMRNARRCQFFAHHFAQAQVFGQQISVGCLLSKPTRLPALNHAKSETNWVNFMPQELSSSSVAAPFLARLNIAHSLEPG
jgi:hypothetical protein